MQRQINITETVEWQQIAPHGGTEKMARALINNNPANYFSLVEASKGTLTDKEYKTLYNHGSRILQAKASH
ncbi:MAG: hypothetical protein J7647_22280 [Cyanobacteria bacterium SBLK]|nr:hypothetical protein [Cyanobacteria bacterium SBLK]